MNKMERITKLLNEFKNGTLSGDDRLDLYAWRRNLPIWKRAYRNWSGRQKTYDMIKGFIEEQIWWEKLRSFYLGDREFNQQINSLLNENADGPL